MTPDEQHGVDEAVRDWARAIEAPAPTRGEVRDLLDRAAPRRSWWPVVLAGAGALSFAVVLFLVMAVAWMASGPPEVVAVAEPSPEVSPVPVPEPPWTGHVERDGDVFDIEGTLVRRAGAPGLELELTGRVAVLAADRAAEAPLVITTDRWRVRVVGTRFTVVSEPFEVVVTEGGVVVSELAGESWTLAAGDRFANGALVRPPDPAPQPVPPPSLETLRKQALSGALDEARAGLLRRVAVDPDEAASWALLARVESRSDRKREAVSAWREVIRCGGPGAAQRARYEAAVLLEGEPAAAASLLEAFLETPDPLAAEARRRLGAALLAIPGEEPRGRAELERVVADHPGTAAASQARAQLDRL